MYLGYNPANLFEAFDLYDHMRAYTGKIQMRASGLYTPTMTLVLQAADLREVTPNTWFSLHPFITAGASGMKTDDMVQSGDSIAKLENSAKEIIAGRAGVSLDDFSNYYRAAKLLSAHEARKLGEHGLIDSIRG